MIEVICFECQIHICWMTDSGPTGLHYCDECYEAAKEYGGEDNNE